jgi:hypothetical protein
MKKHTILFLAVNPTGTDPLALGEEARAIHVELERSGYRDCFELETRWAAQPRAPQAQADGGALQRSWWAEPGWPGRHDPEAESRHGRRRWRR